MNNEEPDIYGDFGQHGWEAVVRDTVQLTRIALASEAFLSVVQRAHSRGSFTAQQQLLDRCALMAAAFSRISREI